MSQIPTVRVDRALHVATMTLETARDNAPEYFAGLVDIFTAEGKAKVVNGDTLWDTWFGVAVDADYPENVEHQGVPRMQRLEGDMATSIHIAAGIEQINISPMKYNGGYLRLDPKQAFEALKNPSIESLNKMATTSVLNVKRNQHYHNMYRLLRTIGKGRYGSVFGVGMRTPELDEHILRQLIAFNGTPSYMDLDDLYIYLAEQPRIMAVKVQRDEEAYIDAAMEFYIGRQIAEVTLEKGIRAVPAMYSTGTHEEEPGLVVMPLTLPEGLEREDLEQEIDVLNDGLVILGRNASYERDSYLYQQFIIGDTLWNSRLSLKLLQGALAYLHGLLSYLYHSLGFVHGDLHWNNVFLERSLPYYVLPILNPDGTVKMKIRLPFRPLMVDLGMARTKEACRFTLQNGPYTVESNDIYNLYTNAQQEAEPTLGFKYLAAKTRITQFHGEKREEGVAPYHFIYPSVTHEEILAYYIENDALSDFVAVDEVEEPYREVLYTTRDDSKNATISALTQEALVLYDRDMIAASPPYDPRRFIYNYLKETEEYYR